MKPRQLTLLLMVAGILIGAQSVAFAQSSGWSEPFEVSPPVRNAGVAIVDGPSPTPGGRVTPTPRPTLAPVATLRPGEKPDLRYGSSWFPDLAIDSSGAVHVIWYSGIATGPEGADVTDLLMYRELRGGIWSPVNNVLVTATGGYTVRNSMVAGRDGKLHVILRSETRIKYTSADSDKAFSAAAWAEPRSLMSGSGYYTALGVDSNNGLHAFWSEAIIDDPAKPNLECSGCADLFYRRSTDNGQTWSAPMNISQSPDGDNRPQVQIDPLNHIHVVWDEGVDWYTANGVPKNGVYRQSIDGGVTWSQPIRFSMPDDAIQQITLAVTPKGNPIVVYRSIATERLYYRYSQDGGTTWSDQLTIPGIYARNIQDNNLDRYSMTSDSSGNIHLLAVGSVTQRSPSAEYQLSLLHLVWNGRTWSTPRTVMDNGLYPEWPTIKSFAGNQLHAVWFTRSPDDLFRSERARYRVWYSALNLSAPKATPLPLFTATPIVLSPTPTSVPPTPTPTALPSAALETPAIGGGPQWEMRGLGSVLVAALPTLLVIGLVIGVRWLLSRRRT